MSRFWQNFMSNGRKQGTPICLGIQGYAVRVEIADDADGATEDGVLVRLVQAGSLAEEAGIIEGDVIMSLGDHRVGSADELFGVLETLTPGMPVPVTFDRNGRRFERLLVLPGLRDRVRKG